MFVLEPAGQLARDRFEVRFGGAGADDEKVCEAGDAAEVDGDDVEGFFVGDDCGAEAGEGIRFDGRAPGKVDAGR